MERARRRLVGVLSLWMLALVAGCGDGPTSPEAEDPMRVLFIGNSLTAWHDMPSVLQALADSSGMELEVRSVAANGMSLADHWSSPTTRRALTSEGPWDLVVVQSSPVISEQGRAYVVDYVQRFATESHSAMAVFTPWPPKGYAQYFPVIHDFYRQISRDSKARLIPVGRAWERVVVNHPEVEMYDPDGGHPNEAGTYATALMVYQSLFLKPAVGLPPRLVLRTGVTIDIPAGVAEILQREAHQAWASPSSAVAR